MHVAVFGANGPTGRLLTQALLEADHDVVAITRHPDQFDIRHPHLRVVQADATDPTAVAQAVTGTEAVVSVLGTPFSRRPITLYSDSATAITRAMPSTGVRRLVVTSSGVVGGWVDPRWNWVERNLTRHILDVLGRTLYDDMRRMEAIVQATDMDWTIMRPLGLANLDPPTTRTPSPRTTFPAAKPPAATSQPRSPTNSTATTTTARLSPSPPPTRA